MSSKRVTLKRWLVPIVILALVITLIYLGFRFWSRMSQPSSLAIDSLTLTLNTDDSNEARAVAARALGKVGDKTEIKPLLEAYENNPVIRHHVIAALKDLGFTPTELAEAYQEVNAEPSLLTNLRDYFRGFDLRSYLIRAAIICIVAGTATFTFSSAVSGVLGRQMSRKASFSISLIIVFTVLVSSVVLRYLPEPPELPEIQPETAEMATIELTSATKDKSMVPMLIDVVSNRLKSTEARCKAAEALGVIGDPQALLALTNVSKEAGVEDRIRVYALWALGNISAAEDKQEKGFDYSEFLLGQIQEYDLVLSFDSTNPYAYLGRGIAHIEQYEYSQAIADFDKAIMYKPSLAKAYYQRGIAHMLEGESQQAVEDFTAAIRWNLSGADIYCRRGAAHQSSHDLDLALDDFSKCLSLDPTRTEAYLSLGLVYREMRQYEQSLQAFQSYLLHSPDAPDATQVEEWILEIEKQIRE